jgi:predicted TIM-barrel fold metal-dependent hydrolase
MKNEAEFDSRKLLENAARQAKARKYDEFLIVDVDAHHHETDAIDEIIAYIENPVIKKLAESIGGRGGLMPTPISNQHVSGRISRYQLRRKEKVEDNGIPRDLVIVKRVMEAIGIDYQILFPTPMLNLGLHPQVEVEVELARAYNRWLIEKVLAVDPQVKTMLYLPFNDPDASLKMIEDFADKPGVVGFMVTSVRYKPVHDNVYMKVYRALEERDMPLGFHAGYIWQGERMFEQLNKFISVHALGFTFFNMIHLTNWVINGMPERFPGLKIVWIESGLAWIPFLMQRLDHEYKMRPSEAPMLQKKPSEYMQEFYYTSQPMEIPDDLDILKMTYKMINAKTQLMYSSDYPHWDFDLPSTIYDLPFLSREEKMQILGGNAKRLFKL